jgi:hypothetical protein
MEVHHHAHPASAGSRKKWTHYIWEFLMLFLAVFCGFLAENFREHQVEHRREKQYMITLLEDLKKDTANLVYARTYWKEINNSIDSLADAIGSNVANTDLVKAYRHLNQALDYFSFRYNDRTISQLKNAGGFRLIRKKNVANKIIEYDQFNNDYWYNITFQYNKYFENVVGLRNRVFVQDIINKIDLQSVNHDPIYNRNDWLDGPVRAHRSPYPIHEQTLMFFEFKNALLAFRKDFTNVNWGVENLQKLHADLIALIQREYHIK